MYRLDYAPAAQKAIRAMRDRRLKARIEAALLKLREDPRPVGAKRLAGQEGLLRIRVGEWRIRFEVRERDVLFVRIGSRRAGMRGWGNSVKAASYLLLILHAALNPAHVEHQERVCKVKNVVRPFQNRLPLNVVSCYN